MNKQFKDLCRWIYYSGRFLNYCDQQQGQELQVVRDEFCKQEELAQNNSFRPWNQGAVMMMLYGLFVLPKEFWRNYLGEDDEGVVADEIIFEGFQFSSRQRFTDDGFASDGLNKCVFLRRLRNACAHANIDVDVRSNRIRFWNCDRNTGDVNFAVSNDLAGLSEFIGEMSRFFINEF